MLSLIVLFSVFGEQSGFLLFVETIRTFESSRKTREQRQASSEQVDAQGRSQVGMEMLPVLDMPHA